MKPAIFQEALQIPLNLSCYNLLNKQKHNMSNKSNTEKSDCYPQHQISYHMLKVSVKISYCFAQHVQLSNQ